MIPVLTGILVLNTPVPKINTGIDIISVLHDF